MINKTELPRRKLLRLKNYDYSIPDFYFVTICCQHKECLFGHIADGEMNLNDAGRMIEKWYRKLEEKFPSVKCCEMIIMPNHFHCIIELIDIASSFVAPVEHMPVEKISVEHMPVEKISVENIPVENIPVEHEGSTLPYVVQWFKAMSTNDYIRGVKNMGWMPFNKKLWQRSYYEHIIRDQYDYERIRTYILNNPKNWDKDNLHI